MATYGVFNLLYFPITLGNNPSFARATAILGEEKDEAILIPIIDTNIPRLTNIPPPEPRNLDDAVATGVTYSLNKYVYS